MKILLCFGRIFWTNENFRIPYMSHNTDKKQLAQTRLLCFPGGQVWGYLVKIAYSSHWKIMEMIESGQMFLISVSHGGTVYIANHRARKDSFWWNRNVCRGVSGNSERSSASYDHRMEFQRESSTKGVTINRPLLLLCPVEFEHAPQSTSSQSVTVRNRRDEAVGRRSKKNFLQITLVSYK